MLTVKRALAAVFTTVLLTSVFVSFASKTDLAVTKKVTELKLTCDMDKVVLNPAYKESEVSGLIIDNLDYDMEVFYNRSAVGLFYWFFDGDDEYWVMCDEDEKVDPNKKYALGIEGFDIYEESGFDWADSVFDCTKFTLSGDCSGFDVYLNGKLRNDVMMLRLPDDHSCDFYIPLNVRTSIKTAEITGIEDKYFTGKKITQTPTVKLDGKTLVKGVDYDISYKNNINIGKATLTLKGIGNYCFSVNKTFEIKADPSAKPAPAGSLTLDKSSASIVCGKTLTLKATQKKTSNKVNWTSSDPKIASVDAKGKITSKQAGTVTITATAAGESVSCVLTVLYKDVTKAKEFWFDPTNYLTAANVVKGYDKQTRFKPANECTRAQMVTFLWRLAGEPAPKSTTTKFKDIKSKDYFYKPVLWAVENGITTGVSKTKFDPQGVCTRAQTVTFLWRMAEKPSPKTTKNKFKDIKEKDYFYKAVLWASEMKIVAGYNDGTFKPQGKCLRRQMVTFLYKYDKYVNGKG
ncbi:MAG: S-layer homology domain-containing protein [Clostridiales bacterium]|nr:S-layer homology domain-containing protein [Clostridiales bacterium]